MSDSVTIAERFLSARLSAIGLGDFPGPFPQTLEEAYAVQDRAIARWGRPVIGWKIGRILSPLAEGLGEDRLSGPIFTSVDAQPEMSPPMPVFAQGYAAVEAEFLLRVRANPPSHKTHFTIEEAAELIDIVHVGIEIASSPLSSINALGPLAVISDFGNNNGLVIGEAIPNWRSSGFEDWLVSTRVDRIEVGTGRGSLLPDGPLGAARFLFEHMAKRGISLRPGQWISSGAVSGVHQVRPGEATDVSFGDRHVLSCRLEAAAPTNRGGKAHS